MEVRLLDRNYAILGLVGGLAVAIGSLLPWATVRTGFGSVDLAGTEGDGVLTLIAGGVIALLSFARFGGSAPSWVRYVTSVIGLLVMTYGVFQIVNVYSNAQDVDSDVVRAGVGVGLWVVTAGGVTAFFSGSQGRTVKPPA